MFIFRNTAINLSSFYFNLLLSLTLAVFYNNALWKLLFAESIRPFWKTALFNLSFLVFLTAVLTLFLSLMTVKYLHKPLAIALLTSAAFASYFMNAYGIVYDVTMIQNTVETDTKEVLDMLSPALYWHILFYALLPSVFVLKIKISYRRFYKECLVRLGVIIACVLTVVINLGAFYKDYSSTFRNHGEIRNLAIPSSYIYYSTLYFSGAYLQPDLPFVHIGQDAKLNEKWSSNTKKVVTVLVVGETARAMNFSLNGYQRETNPMLAKLPIVNFSDVSACGTSTAVSLPCMFSHMERRNFDSWGAKNTDNLLDILQRAGFNVLWRDNNSGCKGVCKRVDNQALAAYKDEAYCNERECFDEVMLANLDEYIDKSDKNTVIVLHQNGSHGPAYSKRYPQRFKVFTPTCETADLSICEQQDIINSYDNSILYTDYFLSQVIAFLDERSDKFSSAMLYVSDHGESLGENNMYLHGFPYSMAPATQIKVPFVSWYSKDFMQRFNIDTQCLNNNQQPLTHANLFHSVLGLMGVNTEVYQAPLDVYSRCRTTDRGE
ncbi:MAG: phosphoethanolamine--lipid A transferase [Oceanospirillaceae bacterium]|nr:phosphoethanolamine--lipid A transferase [Oceanospirillaceae bacterium]